jgi:uncharacterized protein YecE (DUF72 family)
MSPFEPNKTYIGMGGWDLDPFNKLFYPPKMKKGFRKLEYYSQFFDCVEINATFYNTVFTPEQAQRWVRDVAANRDFLFTVKLFHGFTHTFSATADDVRSIHGILATLARDGKLGGLIIQFPYSFVNGPEQRRYLLHLSRVFQPHRLFLEVRDNSWNSPLMYNFFQENKLHLVNVDLPPIKQHIPLTGEAWDGAAYFRMMGRNAEAWDAPWNSQDEYSDRYHYYYSENELEHLAALIERVRLASKKTIVIFHNDRVANSLVNGFQLQHILHRAGRVLVPQNLIAAHPSLKPISSSVNIQHPLFAEG